MRFTETTLPGVLLIELEPHDDERGYFMETYRAEAFAEAGIVTRFVQDNQSGSRQGVLRGLHYQIQQPQGKLVRVIAGEVFDAAVDLRRSSSSFGNWVGMRLTAEERKMVWVPPGFAHGFYTLSDWAEVLYKVTDAFAPQHDRTLIWDDPDVGIEWPLSDGKPPRLSQKDAQGKRLAEAEIFDHLPVAGDSEGWVT